MLGSHLSIAGGMAAVGGDTIDINLSSSINTPQQFQCISQSHNLSQFSHMQLQMQAQMQMQMQTQTQAQAQT